MKLPTFFNQTKKAARPGTAAELAAKLAEAEEAHRAAIERVENARATLANERSPEALAAHRAAVAEAADIETMRGILHDDHAAAAAKEKADARAELEARLNQLEAQLSNDSVLEATRDEAALEADLRIRLAHCLVRRRELRDAYKRKENERRAVSLSLGRKVGPHDIGGLTNADSAMSAEPVIEILASAAREGTPLLAGFLNDLRPTFRSYWPASNRFGD